MRKGEKGIINIKIPKHKVKGTKGIVIKNNANQTVQDDGLRMI